MGFGNGRQGLAPKPILFTINLPCHHPSFDEMKILHCPAVLFHRNGSNRSTGSKNLSRVNERSLEGSWLLLQQFWWRHQKMKKFKKMCGTITCEPFFAKYLSLDGNVDLAVLSQMAHTFSVNIKPSHSI